MPGHARSPEAAPVPVFSDERGRLCAVDLDSLPFVPQRAYVIDGVPVGRRRGGHLSLTQHEVITVVSGRARVRLEDGGDLELLAELGAGHRLHIAPGVWHEIESLTPDLCLMVLASGPYDPADNVTERPSAARAPQTVST